MKKDLYTPEMLFKLGQIYQSLLYVLNDRGHNMYPNANIVPFQCFIMALTKAMPLGIPKKLDNEIEKFLNDIDANDMDELTNTPAPMGMRMSWVQGTMKYQDLLKTHPIKKQRKKLKLTQEELAEKIGVTQKDISRWENYMHKPSQENLQKLAEALDCTVDDIIG